MLEFVARVVVKYVFSLHISYVSSSRLLDAAVEEEHAAVEGAEVSLGGGRGGEGFARLFVLLPGYFLAGRGSEVAGFATFRTLSSWWCCRRRTCESA